MKLTNSLFRCDCPMCEGTFAGSDAWGDSPWDQEMTPEQAARHDAEDLLIDIHNFGEHDDTPDQACPACFPPTPRFVAPPVLLDEHGLDTLPF